MNPHTTSNAASTNPDTTWNAWGATTDAPHCRQGKVQSSAKAMVVTASQRHSLMRAKPNAAAVPLARSIHNAQKSALSAATSTGELDAAALADVASGGRCTSAAPQ